ncbi:MAG: oxidoreductase [Clostridiales Family XIII bacterium]|nr:oxidoreductase [Clostridiales Family XIII bacterium]
MSEKRYVLIVDADRCNQCYACALACKDEHFGNDYPSVTLGMRELGEDWLRMHIEERGSGSFTRSECWPEYCRHCEAPACSSGGAAQKRGDGIVLIDPARAKGDRDLPDLCPFGAIAWNGEKDMPQKCTLCAHLLDAGEPEPRCVEACPTGALLFGDANDPAGAVGAALRADPTLAAQRCVVRYTGKTGRFVAGSVYLSETEVAADADVCLRLPDGGREVARTRTNGFGDFFFRDLPEDRRYEVEIRADGKPSKTLAADTSRDVCFEEITLS